MCGKVLKDFFCCLPISVPPHKLIKVARQHLALCAIHPLTFLFSKFPVIYYMISTSASIRSHLIFGAVHPLADKGGVTSSSLILLYPLYLLLNISKLGSTCSIVRGSKTSADRFSTKTRNSPSVSAQTPPQNPWKWYNFSLFIFPMGNVTIIHL